MTSELFEKAISEVRKLPEERQDEAAHVLLGLVAQDPGTVRLSDAQIRDLKARLEDADDVRASDIQVASTLKKLGG